MFPKCIAENEIISSSVAISWMPTVHLSTSTFKTLIGFSPDKRLMCRTRSCVDPEISPGRGGVWEIILFDGDSPRSIFDNSIMWI